MGPLKNARQERFAQELAKGKSQVEAYAAAGYKPNESHASRAVTNGKLAARVAELKGRAAEKAVVTIENLTERLLAIAAKGEVASDAPLLSVGRAAIMDVAKLNGFLTEKHDITTAGRPLTIGDFYRRDDERPGED